MNNIEQEYFEWLSSKIIDEESTVKYNSLMSHLYDSRFIPMLDMDNNRAEDGKTLRRRFELETGIPRDLILNAFVNYSYCSMLEMMVSLAIRCEETIMTDDEYGDRTGIWFWNMIISLGLNTMSDGRFDVKYVNVVLDRFMTRQYKRNGEGGLFTIDGLKKDLRKEEIWYQMMWFLDFLDNKR